MNLKYTLYFFLLLVGQNLFAQSFDASGELDLKGLASTGDRLPFWMYSNQRGRVYEETNVSSRFAGKLVYLDDFKDLYLEAGAGILFLDGTSKNVVADEIYGRFQSYLIQITLGRKQRPALYNGLSATNENILRSLNTRPLPGLQLNTNGIIFPFSYQKGLGFEASWEEYIMENERYMQEARLHHKGFRLVYRFAEDSQVKLGFQHFAQWGGTNPEGNQPVLTRKYSDAISIKHPSQHHLTSYEVNIARNFRDFKLELIYNHIATDQSGRRFGNTPDGRYGIFYKTHDPDQIINSAIYEFYYTQHQSYDRGGWVDNYFNHFIYRSGWSYLDRVIGTPFFTYDPEADKIINNKFTSHHVGIGGQFSTYFKSYPYRLLFSFSKNDGIYERRYRPKQNIFSGYFDMRVLHDFININLELGTEFNNTASPIFGAGVNVNYKF
jgi:hypothetical protein